MNFLIREATVDDAAGITKLSLQLGYHLSEIHTSENLVAITINPNDIVFVAIEEQKVIGWIHVFQTVRVESGAFAEIGGLVVDDNYQRKGIGKELIVAAKNWTAQHHLAKLRVRCNTKRTGAHAFYHSLEFTDNKEQKVFELNVDVTKNLKAT